MASKIGSTSPSLSDYLTNMYAGLRDQVTGLSDATMDVVNDTSSNATAARQSAVQMQNTVAVQQAQQSLQGESHQSDANWYDRFKNTIQDTLYNVSEGLLGFFDGVVDWGADLIHSWGWTSDEHHDAFVNMDWQAYVQSFNNRLFETSFNTANLFNGNLFNADWWKDTWGDNWDSTEEMRQADYESVIKDSYLNDLGDFGEFVRGMAQNFGNMIPSIVAGVVTGGIATAVGGGAAAVATSVQLANAVSKAQTVASLVTMAIGANASTAHKVYQETGDVWKAAGAGAGDAAIEVGTEILVGKGLHKIATPLLNSSNGVLKNVGLIIGGADDAVGKNNIGKVLGVFGDEAPMGLAKDIAHNAIEEGAEEAVGKLFEPVLVDVWTEGAPALKKPWAQDTAREFWLGKGDSVLMNALSGAVMGVMMDGPSTIYSYSQLGLEGNTVLYAQSKANEEYSAAALATTVKAREDHLAKATAYSGVAVEAYDEAKQKSGKKWENLVNAIADPSGYYSKTLGMSVEEIAKMSDKQIADLSTFPSEISKYDASSPEFQMNITKKAIRDAVGPLIGSDATIQFGETENGLPADYDPNMNTVTIKTDAKTEDALATLFGHEYLIHAVMGNNASVSKFLDFSKRIDNTDWGKSVWQNEGMETAYQTLFADRLFNKAYNSLEGSDKTTVDNLVLEEKTANYVQAVTSGSKGFSTIADLSLRQDIYHRATRFLRNDIKNGLVSYNDGLTFRRGRLDQSVVNKIFGSLAILTSSNFSGVTSADSLRARVEKKIDASVLGSAFFTDHVFTPREKAELESNRSYYRARAAARLSEQAHITEGQAQELLNNGDLDRAGSASYKNTFTQLKMAALDKALPGDWETKRVAETSGDEREAFAKAIEKIRNNITVSAGESFLPQIKENEKVNFDERAKKQARASAKVQKLFTSGKGYNADLGAIYEMAVLDSYELGLTEQPIEIVIEKDKTASNFSLTEGGWTGTAYEVDENKPFKIHIPVPKDMLSPNPTAESAKFLIAYTHEFIHNVLEASKSGSQVRREVTGAGRTWMQRGILDDYVGRNDDANNLTDTNYRAKMTLDSDSNLLEAGQKATLFEVLNNTVDRTVKEAFYSLTPRQMAALYAEVLFGDKSIWTRNELAKTSYAPALFQRGMDTLRSSTILQMVSSDLQQMGKLVKQAGGRLPYRSAYTKFIDYMGEHLNSEFNINDFIQNGSLTDGEKRVVKIYRSIYKEAATRMAEDKDASAQMAYSVFDLLTSQERDNRVDESNMVTASQLEKPESFDDRLLFDKPSGALDLFLTVIPSDEASTNYVKGVMSIVQRLVANGQHYRDLAQSLGKSIYEGKSLIEALKEKENGTVTTPKTTKKMKMASLSKGAMDELNKKAVSEKPRNFLSSSISDIEPKKFSSDGEFVDAVDDFSHRNHNLAETGYEKGKPTSGVVDLINRLQDAYSKHPKLRQNILLAFGRLFYSLDTDEDVATAAPFIRGAKGLLDKGNADSKAIYKLYTDLNLKPSAKEQAKPAMQTIEKQVEEATEKPANDGKKPKKGAKSEETTRETPQQPKAEDSVPVMAEAEKAKQEAESSLLASKRQELSSINSEKDDDVFLDKLQKYASRNHDFRAIGNNGKAPTEDARNIIARLRSIYEKTGSKDKQILSKISGVLVGLYFDTSRNALTAENQAMDQQTQEAIQEAMVYFATNAMDALKDGTITPEYLYTLVGTARRTGEAGARNEVNSAGSMARLNKKELTIYNRILSASYALNQDGVQLARSSDILRELKKEDKENGTDFVRKYSLTEKTIDDIIIKQQTTNKVSGDTPIGEDEEASILDQQQDKDYSITENLEDKAPESTTSKESAELALTYYSQAEKDVRKLRAYRIYLGLESLPEGGSPITQKNGQIICDYDAIAKAVSDDKRVVSGKTVRRWIEQAQAKAEEYGNKLTDAEKANIKKSLEKKQAKRRAMRILLGYDKDYSIAIDSKSDNTKAYASIAAEVGVNLATVRQWAEEAASMSDARKAQYASAETHSEAYKEIDRALKANERARQRAAKQEAQKAAKAKADEEARKSRLNTTVENQTTALKNAWGEDTDIQFNANEADMEKNEKNEKWRVMLLDGTLTTGFLTRNQAATLAATLRDYFFKGKPETAENYVHLDYSEEKGTAVIEYRRHGITVTIETVVDERLNRVKGENAKADEVTRQGMKGWLARNGVKNVLLVDQANQLAIAQAEDGSLVRYHFTADQKSGGYMSKAEAITQEEYMAAKKLYANSNVFSQWHGNTSDDRIQINGDLKAIENDQAGAVKRKANQSLGTVIEYSTAAEMEARIEEAVNKLLGGKGYKILRRLTKGRRLFDDWNLIFSGDEASKKEAIRKFVNDALYNKQAADGEPAAKIYEEIYGSAGSQQALQDFENSLVNDIYALGEAQGKPTTVSRAIERLETIADLAGQKAENLQIYLNANRSFMSLRQKIQQRIGRLDKSGTNQAKFDDAGALKTISSLVNIFGFTQNGNISELQIRKLLNERDNIRHLIDLYDPRTAEFKKANASIFGDPDGTNYTYDFDQTQEGKEMASVADELRAELKSLEQTIKDSDETWNAKEKARQEKSEKNNKKFTPRKQAYEMMSTTQANTAVEFLGNIYRLYQKANTAALDNFKSSNEKWFNAIKEVKARMQGMSKARQSVFKYILRFSSPRIAIAYLCGGTTTEAYKHFWTDLVETPYKNFLTAKNRFTKQAIEASKGLKNGNQNVQATDSSGKKITIKRYAIYAYELNKMSPENLERMSGNSQRIDLNWKNENGLASNSIPVAEMERLSGTLTDTEKAGIRSVFDFYNGYVYETDSDGSFKLDENGKRIIKKNADGTYMIDPNSIRAYIANYENRAFGFSNMREFYYPIAVSQDYLSGPLSGENYFDNILANNMRNGRLMSLRSKTTVIELNTDPTLLLQSYVNMMTNTVEIGEASRDFSRAMNMKYKGESIRSLANHFMPEASKNISYVFDTLVGNRTYSPSERGKISGLLSRYSIMRLGLNVKSVIKQFGSLPTAMTQTGLSNGFKALVNPAVASTIARKSVRDYLQANSSVFQDRVDNFDFVRGMTLSAGPQVFASGMGQKLSKMSLKAMEFTDRFTCYLSFGMAMQTVQTLHNGDSAYDVGTQANMAEALPMWERMILETQSNSNRIEMSRVRSGSEGEFARVLFGMFSSDSSNKVSLFAEARLNYMNASAKNDRAGMSAARRQMGVFAFTAVLSGLIAYGADKLIDFLMNLSKKDEYFSEWDWAKEGWSIAQNTLLDWIPVVGQLSSWFTYGGVDYMPVESLDQLMGYLNQWKTNGYSKGLLTKTIGSLGEMIGVPVSNSRKLFEFALQWNPKYAFQFHSLLYGISASYLNDEMSASIKSRNINRASQIITFQLAQKSVGVTDYTATELAKIKVNGGEYSIRSIPGEIDGEELTDKQKEQFVAAYAIFSTSLDAMVKSESYAMLSAAEKGKAVTKLAAAYFALAKAQVTGEQPTNRIALMIASGANVSSLVGYVAKLEGAGKKADIIKIINGLKLTRRQRLLIMWMLGYEVADESKPALQGAMLQYGASRNATSFLA